jgi:hypothetical protein
MEWNVTIPAGGSAHINVTIFTRINNGGQQEFTSCGEHLLNEGAEIKGYDIRSNGINVTVKCDGGNDCHFCMWRNVWGWPIILPNTPANYHVVLGVVNGRNEKTLTITQYVGKHFEVTGHSTTDGTISLTPMPDGTTKVTWTVHLEHGETAVMHLWEHTNGIKKRGKHMIISAITVDDCGRYRGNVYVKVGICGCCGCRTSNADLQALGDNSDRGFESDTGMEACEG